MRRSWANIYIISECCGSQRRRSYRCGGPALTGHTLLTIHILISAVFFSSAKSKPVQQRRRGIKTHYYNRRIITLATEPALIHTAKGFHDTANCEPFSAGKSTAGVIKLIMIETVESSSRLLAAPGPVPLRRERLE